MTSKKVLITASVFFALIDRNDPRHTQTSAYFRFFAQQQYHLYTCSLTVIKTYQLLQKHMSYSIAKDFLRTIYLGNIEVVYPDEATTKAALKLILGNSRPELSLEQALTNVIADHKQIPQILSYEYSSFFFGINSFTLPY